MCLSKQLLVLCYLFFCRNNSKASNAPAQMTIFYGGKVCVFDDISPEKVPHSLHDIAFVLFISVMLCTN